MRASNNEIKQDIMFCKQLMDRLLLQADYLVWGGHTVMQQDIIRLRRELNAVRQKLETNYMEG